MLWRNIVRRASVASRSDHAVVLIMVVVTSRGIVTSRVDENAPLEPDQDSQVNPNTTTFERRDEPKWRGERVRFGRVATASSSLPLLLLFEFLY